MCIEILAHGLLKKEQIKLVPLNVKKAWLAKHIKLHMKILSRQEITPC